MRNGWVSLGQPLHLNVYKWLTWWQHNAQLIFSSSIGKNQRAHSVSKQMAARKRTQYPFGGHTLQPMSGMRFKRVEKSTIYSRSLL